MVIVTDLRTAGMIWSLEADFGLCVILLEMLGLLLPRVGVDVDTGPVSTAEVEIGSPRGVRRSEALAQEPLRTPASQGMTKDDESFTVKESRHGKILRRNQPHTLYCQRSDCHDESM